MKITCSKCGKRFNAEQHMYICPKCNHYHSQVGTDTGHGTTEKPVKKYRWETDPIELDDEEKFFKRKRKETEIASLDPPTYPKSEMAGEESSIDVGRLDLGKLFKKIWIGLCIVGGCIIFIAGPFSDMLDIGAWSDEPDSWDSNWDSSYTEAIEVDYGEPMDFNTFTVNVGTVSEPEFDGLETEEGYKLVQIDLDITSPYDYEDDSVITDLILWHSYDDEAGYSEEGYSALYISELTDDLVIQNDLINSGLVVEAHYSGNYFCIFEIPEEVDEVTLEITSFVAEDDDEGSYSMDESFRMPLEL